VVISVAIVVYAVLVAVIRVETSVHIRGAHVILGRARCVRRAWCRYCEKRSGDRCEGIPPDL